MSDKKLQAQFVLDSKGKPEFVQGKTKKHYKIRLSLDNTPPGSESVTYSLLDDTYYDPVREVFRDTGGESFEEIITSYGDFDIVAEVSGTARPVYSKLSDALVRTFDEYSSDSDKEAIELALNDIKKY
jgi:hypothetical protein